MKIRGKIGSGFGVVIALLAIISIAGITQLKSVVNGYQNKVLPEIQIQEHTNEIQIALLQVRRAEKDFMARKDLKYVNRLKTHLDGVDEAIVKIEALTTEKDILADLREMRNDINNYRSRFEKLAKTVVERGLTEKEGIQGEFRNTVHNVAELLKKNPIKNGMTLYLTLRKEEKDYMLRSDSKYIERADNVLEKLRSNVQVSSLSRTIKENFFELLNAYGKGFDLLVEVDKEIVEHLAFMKKNADGAFELATEVTNIAAQTANNIESDIAASAGSSEVFLVIISILAVIVGIIAAIYLTRLITNPLRRIVEVANSVSDGNLDLEVDIHQQDEIGELADSFRDMTDALKNKANVAEEIAKGNLGVDIKVASREDVLGNAMVTMRESLKDMQTDLQATIEAQKAGDWDNRCHPDKFQGAYSELLGGVNASLEAVINPVLEGIEIMQQYAAGDLQREMRRLPGKQIVLTDGLNGIRNNLQALINEGEMLANAAQDGQLQTRGDARKFQGGYREIILGMNNTIENILKPVNEAVGCLEKMAKGDLSVCVTGNYQGDHAVMKDSLNTTLSALNDILGQVSVSVDQVSNGSQQVSDSSQSLSQGATEQASSLEEVTSSITELGSQTKQNAENAGQANQLSNATKDSASSGKNRMDQMLEAMSEINESSGQISKIIKVIDEIAFQTNLLALNAAVEAARAGVHGKGFAVVAEEVRNLAQRSAKAARETTDLIEGSVKKVENGTNIANETASALDEIVASVTKVTDLIGDIASASHEQSQGIDQVNQGLTQIDQVTQTNAANAEESASASEELASQAQQLKSMLRNFKLADNGGSYDRNLAIQSVSARLQPTKAIAAASAEKTGNGNKTPLAEANRRVSPEEVIALDDNDFGKF